MNGGKEGDGVRPAAVLAVHCRHDNRAEDASKQRGVQGINKEVTGENEVFPMHNREAWAASSGFRGCLPCTVHRAYVGSTGWQGKRWREKVVLSGSFPAPGALQSTHLVVPTQPLDVHTQHRRRAGC